MDHQVTRGLEQEEAIGAHAGMRIRVVTAWDASTRRFVVHAFVRGSETEEEVRVPAAEGRHFQLMQDAEDAGFASAIAWIDQQALVKPPQEPDAASHGDSPL